LASPVAWSVGRKGIKWAPKTSPGGHKTVESIPLVVLLREKLGVAANAREARKLLNAGLVLVDGKAVHDANYGAGLMDIVSFKGGDAYVVLAKGNRLVLAPVSKAHAGVKYCKVLDKRFVGKGKVQLNLHDGRNQLIEREEDRFKPGDTVKLAMPSQKMQGFAKFEKGCRCFVYKGKHAGESGELIEVVERPGSKPADARIKAKNGELVTLKDYLFVVDKEFEGVEK